MPGNPTYRKVNPADAPIMIIALTSHTNDRGQMYDAASTIIAQKLSQVAGIGQVTVGGSALPAVRVELNPLALNRYGIGIEDVRTAIGATNANRPKGWSKPAIAAGRSTPMTRQGWHGQYTPPIIAYRNGAAVRLSDVAEVVDSVQDLRNDGISNGKAAVLVSLTGNPAPTSSKPPTACANCCRN